MITPDPLLRLFDAPYDARFEAFLKQEKLLPTEESLQSRRFLSRSVLPHLARLSTLFNRMEIDQTPGSREKVQKEAASGLDAYWGQGTNRANLRLAYLLGFMPCNAMRVASVWGELARRGYQANFPETFRAIEWGAGPGSASLGLLMAENTLPLGIPRNASWAWVEQDRQMIEIGERWFRQTIEDQFPDCQWSVRPFHRKIDLKQGLLPRNAPKFNLWLSSFFLNELAIEPRALAKLLFETMKRHLAEDGLVILVEPALKLESRRLLELREALIELTEKDRSTPIQVLLPCLGHQKCGALVSPEDWCHDEAQWWRPPSLRLLDELTGLDHKSLSMSYLVLQKTTKKPEELFKTLQGTDPARTYRMISDARKTGPDDEVYLCGQTGKWRARIRRSDEREPLERGTLFLNTELRGDPKSARIETADIQ